MADVVEVTILEDGSQHITERAFTADELAQREKDAADFAAAQAAAEEAAATKAAARAALLERLGMTEDEAVLLLGGV
jgi:phosphopantetheinyl transferase (holo-ACP synthase)